MVDTISVRQGYHPDDVIVSDTYWHWHFGHWRPGRMVWVNDRYYLTYSERANGRWNAVLGYHSLHPKSVLFPAQDLDGSILMEPSGNDLLQLPGESSPISAHDYTYEAKNE